MLKKQYHYIFLCLVTAVFFCCNKDSFTITDPETGKAPEALTSDTGQCYLVKIAQKNISTTKSDNVFVMERNALFTTTRMLYYDSLTGKTDFNITATAKGDSIVLNTGEYMITDSRSGYVKYFVTRSDMADPSSDNQVYKYVYNAAGYLTSKLVYINGGTTAAYHTNYNYDNGLLTDCVMYTGSQKNKLLEATIQYDTAMTIKPWLYLFPDFFEGNYYLQAFNFGKKQTLAAKSIVTRIYDPSSSSLLDTWSTTLVGYVLSKDKYVLQTSAKGDLQQGLGVLFGTVRFEYQCK